MNNDIRAIIIGCVISLMIAPLATFGILSRVDAGQTQGQALTANPPERSEADLSLAISSYSPSLRKADGSKNFTITGHKRLAPNWYCVWIDDDTVKVLINDPASDASYMQILLGPGTVFSKSDMNEKGIPSTIFKEFVDAKK